MENYETKRRWYLGKTQTSTKRAYVTLFLTIVWVVSLTHA